MWKELWQVIDVPYWRYVALLYFYIKPKESQSIIDAIEDELVRDDAFLPSPEFFHQLERAASTRKNKKLIYKNLQISLIRRDVKFVKNLGNVFNNFRPKIDVSLYVLDFDYRLASKMLRENLPFALSPEELEIYAHYFFDPKFVRSVPKYESYLRRCKNLDSMMPYLLAYNQVPTSALFLIGIREADLEQLIHDAMLCATKKLFKLVVQDESAVWSKKFFNVMSGIKKGLECQAEKGKGETMELLQKLKEVNLVEDEKCLEKKTLEQLTGKIGKSRD